MTDRLRNVLLQLAVRIAVGIAVMLTAGSTPQAAEPMPLGYWSCNGTEWVAVGGPEHPKPLIACGGTYSGAGTGTKELCEAAGGFWGPIGLFPEPICSQPTLDAGRYCADNAECAASCDADLTKEQYDAMLKGEPVVTGGFCSQITPVIGCHAMVEQGRMTGVLCID